MLGYAQTDRPCLVLVLGPAWCNPPIDRLHRCRPSALVLAQACPPQSPTDPIYARRPSERKAEQAERAGRGLEARARSVSSYYTRTHTHAHTHTHTHTLHTYTYDMYILYIHTCIHMYTYVHAYIRTRRHRAGERWLCVHDLLDPGCLCVLHSWAPPPPLGRRGRLSSTRRRVCSTCTRPRARARILPGGGLGKWHEWRPRHEWHECRRD